MSEQWISDRLQQIDASGIRKVFDLVANMTDPINLSIGQPHFDTPEPVKEAFKQAIDNGYNAYSQTQGIEPLLKKLQTEIDSSYPGQNRQVFVSSGTSGALMLALCTLVNPGDEVIVFDPYFVMYKHLTTLAGGKVVEVDTYPDFEINLDRVRAAITDRTKVILFNCPGNPTGAIATQEQVQGLAELAAEKNIALISDEIYHQFCYDKPLVSPALYNDQTIVIDGFSKSHSMTGHRVGYCHGPEAIIQQMLKLQQFTFVCAPHPAQWAALAACDVDMSAEVEQYRQKRNFMLEELKQYDIQGAEGAFYLFVKTPWGTGTEFVTEAIARNLLIIPGNVFSSRDTHFRISYAATQEMLERGADVLKQMFSK